MNSDKRAVEPAGEILIVDDMPANLQLLFGILIEGGYQVRSAVSGQLALDTVVAKVPDLILLDVRMPEVDGFEVCRRLKASDHTRDVPVIFVSAAEDTVDKVKGFGLGGVDYVTKPFQAGEVLARVRTHLDLSKLRAELEDRVRRRTAELEIANQGLGESEAKFRGLVESSSDLIWEVNKEGVYTYASPQIGAILGYKPDEVIGKTPFDLMPPEEASRIEKIFEDTIAKGEPFIALENVNLHKDGRPVVLETNGVPVLDAAGKAIGYRGVDRDITDRKRAEEERETLIAKLESQNAELERFTYTVSHDLKSPLITINGYVGMLREDLAKGDSGPVEDDLARISNAANKMDQLLRDVLELSRIGRLVNASVDVSLEELAHEAIELVGGQVRESGVQVEISPDLPVVFGDPLRLREILQNLIDNAVKYMGDQAEPRVEIGSRRDGNKTICYVRDNGIGIDPRYREKVFGLFDQLDPKVEGSGIGLALTRRIVEVHGGRIWVESEGPGRGATFCFTLAASPAGRQSSAAACRKHLPTI